MRRSVDPEQEAADRRDHARVWTLGFAHAEHARTGTDIDTALFERLNGSRGPRFRASRRNRTGERTDWPIWTDSLSESTVAEMRHGGQRLRGRVKSGFPDRPLVSYVTVVRDNVSTIARAIESVQRQTYPNVEHIVLDGASTDGTVAVLEDHAGLIDYFASEPDRGLYDALNKAVPLARGDVICVLNSDDWLEPDAAETAVRRLDRPDRAALLLTGANARGAQDDAVGQSPIRWYPPLVHPGCHFACALDCHNGIYATRAAYAHSGPYDSSYEIAADFKWIMTCLDRGIDFVYTGEITTNYVFGGVSADAHKHGSECFRAICERFPSLSQQEAGGLYHSFFLLPTSSTVPGKPENQTEFLRELLLRHSDDLELAEAVAWALLLRPDHRTLETVPRAADGRSNVVAAAARRTLRRSPALHRIARRLRTWIWRT